MAKITQQQQTLYFSGNLLINNISETLNDLRAMALDAPLTLDFTQVQSVDTVAISLILEIKRELHARHPRAAAIEVVGVPDNLRSLMQLYDVDAFLLN